MPSKAAATGSVSYGQNLANTIGDFASKGAPFAWPDIEKFSNWLDALTSPDATARMTAAGPQITDITAQTDAAKQSIKNLPRGGEQFYLLANADQSKASAIGNLLTSEFAAAQKEKGILGEWAVGTTLAGLGEAGNLNIAAGQLAAELARGDAAANAAILNSLSSVASQAIKSLTSTAATATSVAKAGIPATAGAATVGSTVTPATIGTTAGTGAAVGTGLADPAAALTDYATLPLTAGGVGSAAGGAGVASLPLAGAGVSAAEIASLAPSLATEAGITALPLADVGLSGATVAGLAPGAEAGAETVASGAASGSLGESLAAAAGPIGIAIAAALGIKAAFDWADQGPTAAQKATFDKTVSSTNSTVGQNMLNYAQSPGLFGGAKAAGQKIDAEYQTSLDQLNDPNRGGWFMTDAQRKQAISDLTASYNQAKQLLASQGG